MVLIKKRKKTWNLIWDKRLIGIYILWGDGDLNGWQSSCRGEPQETWVGCPWKVYT